MTWFSLPVTLTNNTAAFCDSDGAARWLSVQPQANTTAILSELVGQIKALNVYSIDPRQRFKILEVLRKTIFTVSGECQRRYENKPLPLLPAEQFALDSVRKLWRAYAIGYLHCLRACLDRDASIVRYSDKVAHRVLSCLRMEQMNCYLAGAELDNEFWRILHSVLASAEQLDVVSEPVTDRQLGETSESTISGQYCMILLLHLAHPFSLSRAQFAAATRWLARWREQAAVLTKPDTSPKSCCIALDLSQDRPIHDNLRVAGFARWLSVNDVLRKMSKRLAMLAAGESPESLRLGTALSTEACVALLNNLSDRLKYPQQTTPNISAGTAATNAVVGLENIHRLLGGKGPKKPASLDPFSSTLSQDQMAIFGHVVHKAEIVSEIKTETWQVVRREQKEMHLLRPAANVDERIAIKSLLAIKIPQQEHYSLAAVNSLYSLSDHQKKNLYITAILFPGEAAPLIAEMREKANGKISRHPAFLFPAENSASSPSVILPAGIPTRALSIKFYEAQTEFPLAIRLVDNITRGGDHERWSVASA